MILDMSSAIHRNKLLLPPTLILLVYGLVGNLYLGYLYVQVNTLGDMNVDSFCAFGEGLDCITVATSRYSAFLGIPLAFYGAEFFFLSLLVVLLSVGRRWRLRSWDSLLFYATVLSLPVCGLLAWISAFCISSICIVCCSLYIVILVLFLMLVLANLRRLRALLTDGPREMVGLLRTPRGGLGLAIVLAAALSQFLWVPGLVSAGGRVEGVRTAADQPSGTAPQPESATHRSDPLWLTLPAAGLSLGSPDAPVKIEEFTDFQCPFCGKAHQVMMEVLRSFPTQVYLTHRDYPLDSTCHPGMRRALHPHACRSAYYARCAAEQDNYWPFEALLFEDSERLDEDSLKEFARNVGLDMDRLAECVESPDTHQAVLDDIRQGMERGMRGTPTFFVNGEMVVGFKPFEFWEEKITALLEGK